jgi:PAS domain S-box-containing protein
VKAMMNQTGRNEDLCTYCQEKLENILHEEDVHGMTMFFASSDCGMMQHSMDGKEIFNINEAALKILGYESEEELKEDGFDMISPSVFEEDRLKIRKVFEKLKKVGDNAMVSYRVRHKDGKEIQVVGNIKVVEKQGELIIQRLCMDCTEQIKQSQKETREREKRHLDIIHALSSDYSSEYYMNLDTGKGFAYQRKCNEDELGGLMNEEECLLTSLDEYIENEVYEKDQKNLRESLDLDKLIVTMGKQKSLYFTYRRLTGDKTEYYRMKIVRAGDWEKEHNIVVGFRSVDQEMQAELAQKIQLEKALQQAQNASRAKTTFLNNMSHDIRTPMNAIIGFTDLAIDHVEETELVRSYLEKIKVSGNHLLNLINDVLDMSRIESGRMQLEEKECNLLEIMSGIKDILQNDAETKQLEFLVDHEDIVDEEIICDSLRLNQILLNCLGNAVKFTNPGGIISARIIQKPDAPSGYASYVFKIRDTGIGMSKEFTKRIFEPFERERTSTVSGIQGTGLGMSITKSLVDMMSGTISVESEEGKGTEFTISLQFKLSRKHSDMLKISGLQENEEANDQEETIILEDKHILLVEDGELNREIAETILLEMGMQVDTAVNGKEAVEKVQQKREDTYDLILMDIQMPVMDGYEATRKIRGLQNERKASIPIVAMTANAFEEDRKRALEAGMDDHLTKPIQVPEMMHAIQKYIKKSEIMRQEDTFSRAVS